MIKTRDEIPEYIYENNQESFNILENQEIQHLPDKAKNKLLNASNVTESSEPEQHLITVFGETLNH